MTTLPRCGRMAALAVALCGAVACGPLGDTGRGEAASPPAAASSPAEPGAKAPAAPTLTPHGGLPDLTGLDRADATQVSKAAVTVMWTVDAAVDRGQRDAYLRARSLLDPGYAAAIADGPAGELPTLWRRHRAYARVTVVRAPVEGDVEPDTPTAARRRWAVTVVPTGRDGWLGAPVRTSVFVTLTRSSVSAPWRVSATSGA